MAKYCGEHVTCIVTGAPGADLHHLVSRAAGGSDEPENLLPVSNRIHSEIHYQGLAASAKKYPAIKAWLLAHEWEFDDYRGKWRRAK